jgi:hypothetical protein
MPFVCYLSQKKHLLCENAPEYAIASTGSLLGVAMSRRNSFPWILPFSAYDDLSAFKLYLIDVDLLRRLSLLDPIAVP